jgi:L-lysine 2,3-aminomutase
VVTRLRFLTLDRGNGDGSNNGNVRHRHQSRLIKNVIYIYAIHPVTDLLLLRLMVLQVLPHHLELEEHPEFVTDPLGEEAANQLPGVLKAGQAGF